MDANHGQELDLEWLSKVRVNLRGVEKRVDFLKRSRFLNNEYQAAWLLKAITCIDLTTLSGDDTTTNVDRLCLKAARPLSEDILTAVGFADRPIQTAAVCVYPSKVNQAVVSLTKFNALDKVKVASVATGFPSGQYPLKTRLDEIKYAIEKGATEIDVVIDRSLVMSGQWFRLYQEIQQMKAVCGQNIHLKTILGAGELDNMNNIYKASLVAMMAGSDFIKTSTGKEAINATLPIGVVMCRAIRDYYEKTGYKVGFKPAGGIKTSTDALDWLILVKEELGDEWLNPELFRIGASSLLGDIERQIYHFVTGRYAALHEFSMG